MTHRLRLGALSALLLATSPARAKPGREVVLVLDNSCSMVAGASGRDEVLPANDPQRAAVLGALLLEGLSRDSGDPFTVVAFDTPGTTASPNSADGIRALPYAGGTWFRPVLTAARDRLVADGFDDRLLVVFTDGSPEDIVDPAEARSLVDASGATTIAVGLYADPRTAEIGRTFLGALVRRSEDLAMIDAGDPDAVSQVVQAFTTSYARALGSRPLTGRLAPGEARSIDVPRYVIEVLVALASRDPGGPFTVDLVGPAGSARPRAAGDNGCPSTVALANAPRVCDPPRRHYQVFRDAHDPDAASTWTLSLPRADGPVDYGIILRYDIDLALDAPTSVRVGEPVPVVARLTFRGRPFDDPAFFAASDFVAEVSDGKQTTPLRHVGGGRLEGGWTPGENGVVRLVADVRTGWLALSDAENATVDGFLPLVLAPRPGVVELGSWAGTRGPSTGCADISLADSSGADRVPVVCEPTTVDGVAMTCEPLAGSEATLPDGSPGRPLVWRVCATAPSCCGDLADRGAASIRLRGEHSYYADGGVTLPVRFSVSATGWLACWWVELAVAVSLGVLVWFVWGWTSPRAFDPGLQVKVAGRESALSRAFALTVAEQPGGRRGFYRHATFALDDQGNPVSISRRAVVVVQAGPGGVPCFVRAAGLERLDRRTRKWDPVDPQGTDAGPDLGTLYRVGRLYIVFS